MSKRKNTVKAPISRIKDDSRIMLAHESMVDFIKATANPMHQHHAADSFMNVLTSGMFDFRSYNLEDDLIYSDDDNDEGVAATRLLEPHPRIRQLTEEEAEKHAAELIAEEERRKEKTEKNKRKKMRKKEKKRLKKENAVQNNLPEEEQGKSDSDSENEEENPIIQSNIEANEEEQTQHATAGAECDESSGENNNNKEEEEIQVKIIEEDEDEKELDFNNSYARLPEFESEATCNQEPPEREKEEKNELTVVQMHKEEKPKFVGKKAEVKKKDEPDEEKSIDSTLEEFAKRSRELARSGNRLAASGQYDMAVKCFTDAIKFNPKEFRLFGNRSLCYERMQQHEKALRDADVALSMEPDWIKGLFRKGKALCGLKKYYEASLVYRAVLNLEPSSAEAAQELKRAQTLHLMEMGFSWAQSNEALKVHATLEDAVEALFGGVNHQDPADTGASRDNVVQPLVREEQGQDGEWTVLQSNRTRMQHVKEFDALVPSRSKSQSPTHPVKNPGKLEHFSIWVGSLSPTVTYPALHELFSRVGAVHGIKMLLEHQCAFVHYIRKEDCDRAIQSFNGIVFEGTPLSVRYPIKGHNDSYSRAGPYKKECFFWRTSGCTRQDCTFRHVPEHKNIDRVKFTSRLGQF
ncbi:stress-induced-phosphoprotein 1 isoform X1 [Solea solea]|uniref:stress-induced-phosphoprotein 1 isoform X1 n=1 Tax=Solea solea TaxID=90069 RepID=UPI00272D335F|nr:stress-induced-phosphoprotein 1 isoform X1 [Solea solea]